MALSNQDIVVLEQIVSLEGKCMSTERCNLCPFRAMCLPEFLNPVPPTQQQRERMAMDILMHHHILDEDMSRDDICKEYKWDVK